MQPKYQDPSTETAKFMTGFHKDGRLGARERGKPELGKMSTSEMALKEARGYGLPEIIRGNPLGCGCQQAHLVSASPVKDGMIEANYHCSSNWKNYVVFQVRQYTKEGERGLKINKFGELVESEGYQAGELEQM